MTELASTLPWIGISVIVLVALVLGMGFALHFQTRLPTLAQPAIAALQSLIPPIGLFLVGRNLALKNLDFFQAINPQGLAAWVQRLGSALMVGLAVAIIIVRLLDRDDRAPAPGRPLILAFVIYFVTNVLLNAYFGTVPGIVAPSLYGAIVAIALMMTREQGYANLLVAIRWTLTLLMVASLALIPFMPNLVIQPNSLEVRLPVITFRLFGLGSGPNSIGPLAATLILVAIHLPFRSRVLQFVSLASAVGVFILAQSQTAWIAMGLILPPYLAYRYITSEKDGRRRQLSPSLVLGLVGLGLAGLFAASLLFIDWPAVLGTLAEFAGLGGDGLTDRSISGRGAIWTVAIQTFMENPLFGYGLSAWDSAFRAKLNMPFAFHAHNQLMQSLSVGGLLGLGGLLFYLCTLVYYSLRYARFTRGLAPALLTLILVRCISEVPLDLLVALSGDMTTHLALLMLLSASAALEGRHARRPAVQGAFNWRASTGGRTLAPARSIAVDPQASDDEVVGAILRYGGRDRGPAGPAPSPGGPVIHPGGPRGPSASHRPAGPASPIGPRGPGSPGPGADGPVDDPNAHDHQGTRSPGPASSPPAGPGPGGRIEPRISDD